jgi:hypothetical protein
MHPYIRELLAQRDAWFVPRARKEPYTINMFQALATFLQSHKDPLETFLCKDSAIFDWARLGIFTGSRVSEYAQTRLRAGTRFNTIPRTPNEGIWAGQALAFLCANFIFYSARHELIPLANIAALHCKGQVVAVHIRFRFDKSPTNFSIRKFQTTKDSILDPVLAAVSCIYRADLLHSPISKPVGVYRDCKKGLSFLCNYHLSKTMRQVCVWAYPNPTHHLRVNILCIVPHSN